VFDFFFFRFITSFSLFFYLPRGKFDIFHYNSNN